MGLKAPARLPEAKQPKLPVRGQSTAKGRRSAFIRIVAQALRSQAVRHLSVPHYAGTQQHQPPLMQDFVYPPSTHNFHLRPLHGVPDPSQGLGRIGDQRDEGEQFVNPIDETLSHRVS